MKKTSLCLVVIILAFACSPLTLVTLARASRQDATQTTEKIYEAKQVDRKAKITKRSEPPYTETARRNRTSGSVVLRVVLKSTGEIGDIKVIRDLPDGLTDECIRVTREIKFEPAMKDGAPVSQYTRVEYSFNAG